MVSLGGEFKLPLEWIGGIVFAPSVDRQQADQRVMDRQAEIGRRRRLPVLDGVEDADGATELATALVATGFSYEAARREKQAVVLQQVIAHIRDIRRMGSASVDLCSVACGRVDAYAELGLKPWDMAAGTLMDAASDAAQTAPRATRIQRFGERGSDMRYYEDLVEGVVEESGTRTVTREEAGASGAAMMAAIQQKIFPDMAACVDAWVTVRGAKEFGVDAAAKVTSKGQVTVPKAVRDALGIETGDEVVFRVDDRFGRLR